MASACVSLPSAVRIGVYCSLVLTLACDDAATSPTQQAGPRNVGYDAASFFMAPTGDTALGAVNLVLPHTDTVTSSVPAFEMKQRGNGFASMAGRFEITNPASQAVALDAVHQGIGPALFGWNAGTGRGVVAITSNPNSPAPALEVRGAGLGTAASAGVPAIGAAMDVKANNANSTNPAATIAAFGKGPALNVDHRGPSGAIAAFQVAGVSRVRFSRSGKGFFNGGTQTGGADVAEAFAVEGDVRAYERGDVLVISEHHDRRVERSAEAYSSRVIGVYATKPGVLLTERDINASLKDHVAVGVIGVIPTKVSGENGPIRRGDMLVSAGTPGHAMLGTERDRMLGAIIGKALAPFDEPGRGMIPVLVNVK